MSDEGFNRRVLEWLRERCPDAVEVTAVDGHGYDMAGDTEGGFYASFDCDIRYLDAEGKAHYLGIEGSDMASLWKWVVTRDWS